MTSQTTKDSRATARDTIGHFLFLFDRRAYASPEAAADAFLQRLTLEGYSVVGTLGHIANARQGRRVHAMWSEVGP